MKNIISAEDISYETSEETQTFSINANIVYKAPLHYESDNSAITVDENGIVTIPADVNETATITITADAIHDYDSAEKTITVSEGISLSFWEEECKTSVASLINTCGSFSWETQKEEADFSKLYMKADCTASRDAGLFEVDFLLVKAKKIPAIRVIWDLLTAFQRLEEFQKNIWCNHAIETYMCWMEIISGESQYVNSDGYKNVVIKCPVDISLYRNGKLVTNIVNNEILYSDGPACYVIDDVKVFYLKDDDYTFKITGYDTGTMDVDIEEYDKNNEKIQQTNYIDIPVSKNKTVTLQTGTGTGTNGSSYSMQLPDGTEKAADVSASGDMLDNVEISVVTTGSGSVFGAGNYTKGEKVSLTAVEDNSGFAG